MKIVIPDRLNVPGTELNIKILAQDENKLGQRPVLFILPGGPGAAIKMYQPYETLIDIADLVFHDPRGVGASQRQDKSTYTMVNYIDDVDIIRQQLKLNKINILGKSYGCSCALGYTLKYQQHINKIIYSCGPASYRFCQYAKENIERIGTPLQKELCLKALRGDINSNEELLTFFKETRSLYAISTKAEEIKQFNPNDVDYSFEPLQQGFKSFLHEFDFEPMLDQINIPSLTISAEKDWIVDPRHIESYCKKIQKTEYYMVKNAGHSLEKDTPTDYFSQIRQFFTK